MSTVTRRFTIKEPSEREFQAFKTDFLKAKAKEHYDDITKREIDDLMRIVGKLQSEKDELKATADHWRRKYNSQASYTGVLKLPKKKLNYDTLKKFTHQMLNDLLWMELRFGTLYN